MAEDLREYEQARSHYQQALAIKIEFNDRYNQARTYYHLGQVAEAMGELVEAKTCYLKDLEISVEFEDQHELNITFKNLARFCSEHPDDTFWGNIAQVLNEPVDAVQQRFAALNAASADEPDPPAEA